MQLRLLFLLVGAINVKSHEFAFVEPVPTPQPTRIEDVANETSLKEHAGPCTTLSLSADIYLSSSFSISNVANLVIFGNGFKIDGQKKVTCIIATGSNTTIELHNLVITNGYSETRNGGGLILYQGKLLMTGCSILRNSVSSILTWGGGGIYACCSASLTMIGCTVSDNSAAQGGGMYSSSASLSISQCIIERNEAISIHRSGGGLCFLYGSINMQDCVIDSNTAMYGGGLFVMSCTSVVMNGMNVSGNTASAYGGGLYVVNVESFSLSGCNFIGNEAILSGGAMYVELSPINFGDKGNVKILSSTRDQAASSTQSRFERNIAGLDGGAIFTSGYGSTVVLGESMLAQSNTAYRNGGFINSYNVRVVQIDNVPVVLNRNIAATGSGGAIYLTFADRGHNGSAVLVLNDALLEDNLCYDRGGAIIVDVPEGVPREGMLHCEICGYDDIGAVDCYFIPVNSTWREWKNSFSVQITGSIFQNNSAAGFGGSGGALVLTNGDVLLSSTKFLDNSAYNFGGALYLPRAQNMVATTSMTLDNIIFDGNFVSSGKGHELYSETSATLSFLNGTEFRIRKSVFRNAGSNDITIESGGQINWSQDSGITCPAGYRVGLPALISPFPSCPLPQWSNASCLSSEGPCSSFGESCWPPMLTQSVSFNCTPCMSGSFSLDAGSLAQGELNDIVCIDECPYGGDCSHGGSDLRARSGYYGILTSTDSVPTVKFISCPSGFCCEHERHTCEWNNTCFNNRAGLFCGGCQDLHSISLFGSKCISNQYCDRFLSLPFLSISKTILYLVLFFFWPSLGFASEFALVSFYDQMFNLLSRSRPGMAATILGFILNSNLSSFGQLHHGLDVCAWEGMQPLQRYFVPHIELSLAATLITAAICGRMLSQLLKCGPSTAHLHAEDLFHGSSDKNITFNVVSFEMRCIVAMLQVFNINFVAVLNATVELLVCTSHLPGSQKNLIIDAEIVCYTWWQKWFMLALGLVICIGLSPLIYLCFDCTANLWRCEVRSSALDHKSRRPTLCFISELMTSSFKDESWFWLGIVNCQRMLLSIFAALTDLTETTASLWEVSLCTIFLVLHTTYQPFRNQTTNISQTLLLVCATLVAACNVVPADLKTNAMSTSREMQGEVQSLVAVEELLLWFPVVVVSVVAIVLNRAELGSYSYFLKPHKKCEPQVTEGSEVKLYSETQQPRIFGSENF